MFFRQNHSFLKIPNPSPSYNIIDKNRFTLIQRQKKGGSPRLSNRSTHIGFDMLDFCPCQGLAGVQEA